MYSKKDQSKYALKIIKVTIGFWLFLRINLHEFILKTKNKIVLIQAMGETQEADKSI